MLLHFPSKLGFTADEFLAELSAAAKEKNIDVPPHCVEILAAVIQKNNEKAGSQLQQHMSANLEELSRRIDLLEKKAK